MSSGMVEVFTFDINFGPTKVPGEVLGKGQWSGPAGIG